MRRSYYYILDGHTPVPTDDVRIWSAQFEQLDTRRVAWTDFDGGYVSTVFLGLDHAFLGGPPLLFETMIFGGPNDGYQRRYGTWADAEVGHAAAVTRATCAQPPSADAVDPSASDPGTPTTREKTSSSSSFEIADVERTIEETERRR